jgi:hypothetical protein
MFAEKDRKYYCYMVLHPMRTFGILLRLTWFKQDYTQLPGMRAGMV